MIDHFNGPYRWLSNFWRLKDGTTSEHWFQRGKATCMEDVDLIMAAVTPSEAKRLGQQIEIRRDWDEIKDDVMLHTIREKFKDPELAKKLLETGVQRLEEGNYWHDRYWGVCYCNACGGVGQNRLGQILMQVRDELRKSNDNTKVSDLR